MVGRTGLERVGVQEERMRSGWFFLVCVLELIRWSKDPHEEMTQRSRQTVVSFWKISKKLVLLWHRLFCSLKTQTARDALCKHDIVK